MASLIRTESTSAHLVFSVCSGLSETERGLARHHWCDADDRIGVMDNLGNVAIADRVDQFWVIGFTDGLAPAASGGKWGYVDTKGKWVIQPRV